MFLHAVVNGRRCSPVSAIFRKMPPTTAFARQPRPEKGVVGCRLFMTIGKKCGIIYF